jgi:uncharacterized repeat protein (TIGR03803 family)
MLTLVMCALAEGQAQYKVLWSFAGAPNDGSDPTGNLVSDQSGNIYGVTGGGGSSTAPPCSGGGCGTVFELSPNSDGTWTNTILYSFCSNFSNNLCQDGSFPQAGLLRDNKGNLYGTTTLGGDVLECGFGTGCGGGTVFKLSPPSSPGESWTEVVLHSFCSSLNNFNCLDGALPLGQLTADKLGNLYGTTSTGGLGGSGGACCIGGTVFELSHGQAGWNETVLHNFCANGKPCLDGVAPKAGVTFDKTGNLYGTTASGGAPEGDGTLYKLSPGSNGWTETVLLASKYPYHLGGGSTSKVSFDSLGRMYTTVTAGSVNGGGGIIQLANMGSVREFSFDGADGKTPMAGVLVSSKNSALFGTTYQGGAANGGTVFQITGPSQEAVLYSFCSLQNCEDGFGPSGSIITDSSGNLYGTAQQGGANSTDCYGSGCGVVFEIIPQPTKRSSIARPASLRFPLVKKQ